MTMRRIASLLVIGSFAVQAAAQTAPDTWLVSFTDKENTPYSLSDPGVFLSERAIQRRQVQGIALDALDLPVDPAYIAQVLAQGDVQLVNRSKWFNTITIRTTDEDALVAIAALPFVHGMRGARSAIVPSPPIEKFGPMPGAGPRGGDEEEYGASYHQVAMMNGHMLHGLEARGEGMVIGVLDSGFLGVDVLPGFESLRQREGILFTRDMADHDGDVYLDHWHGRSVLSCLAVEIPGVYMGTAPRADYVLLRTEVAAMEYVVEEDHWASGAELCDSLGVDIINTSLGYTTFDDPEQDHSYGDLDGLTTRISMASSIAASRGMVPVTSAGNQGASDWHHISAPADAIGILAVGAVNADGDPAWFSGHGPSADGRVKPDVAAMGQGTLALGFDGLEVQPLNGTSFSAPLVAGLVACLWQLHPQRTAADIIEAVRQSASHYNDPQPQLGHGIPDFMTAHAWLTLTTQATPDAATDLVVFPNPFQDRITITAPELRGLVRIELFDAMGRCAWRKDAVADGVITFGDLDRLATGPFVLRLWHEGSIMTRTLVKTW